MQAMDVHAYARIDEYTDIEYLNCRDGGTEFTFDTATLVLETSERGLHHLAEVVMRAVQARRDCDQTK